MSHQPHNGVTLNGTLLPDDVVPNRTDPANTASNGPAALNEQTLGDYRSERSITRERAEEVRPYDLVILSSFGGPEGQEDVIPFLRNVTAGRGIPDERLEEVATHYRAITTLDELDALIITDTPLPTGIYMQARVIGVMKFVDDGEVDDKIVCVPADDRQTGDAIKTLADLPAQLIKQIEFHFNNYKALKKPGSTKVDHWGDIEEAKQVIRDSQTRWKQQ